MLDQPSLVLGRTLSFLFWSASQVKNLAVCFFPEFPFSWECIIIPTDLNSMTFQRGRRANHQPAKRYGFGWPSWRQWWWMGLGNIGTWSPWPHGIARSSAIFSALGAAKILGTGIPPLIDDVQENSWLVVSNMNGLFFHFINMGCHPKPIDFHSIIF